VPPGFKVPPANAFTFGGCAYAVFSGRRVEEMVMASAVGGGGCEGGGGAGVVGPAWRVAL